MNHLYCYKDTLKYATSLGIEGVFEYKEATAFKKLLSNYINANKDLFIDIRDIESIDLVGLNSLLLAKELINNNGYDFYIFANQGNPILQLLNNIKFKNQFQFRDIIILDSIQLKAS